MVYDVYITVILGIVAINISITMKYTVYSISYWEPNISNNK